MDSITQAALGAAVGEATLGHRVGKKGALWGAVLGTLPDLDVLADPFLTEVEALAFHRGLTHGLAFSLLVGPLVGWLLARLHRRDEAGWRGWSLLAVLALFTHPLIDSLTVYGTQLFQPFSDYPVVVASVSIVDLLYTGPLVLGLLVALRRPIGSPGRRRANQLGLIVSTAYLGLTLLNKAYVTSTFERALAAQGLAVERVLTTPTLGNNLLWMGLSQTPDSVYVGMYSLFDGDRRVRFEAVPRRAALLGTASTEAAYRLRWFSRGFFSVSPDGSELYDLRFGRTEIARPTGGAYIFTFELLRDEAGDVVGFRQQPPRLDRFEDGAWRRFWRRMWGDERVADQAVTGAP